MNELQKITGGKIAQTLVDILHLMQIDGHWSVELDIGDAELEPGHQTAAETTAETEDKIG